MHRILKSNLTDNDLEYIRNYKEKQEGLELYNKGLREEGLSEGIEQGIKQGIEQGVKQGIEQEKKRTKEIIKQAEIEKQQVELENTIIKLHYKDKKNIDEIANIINKSKEYINKLY